MLYLSNLKQHIPMESWKTEWPVAEVLLVWLHGERLARGVASYQRSRWYAGPIHEGHIAGDAVHAAPSRKVAEEEFALAHDNIDDFVQALVAGHLKHEPHTDYSIVSDLTDGFVEELAEQAADEVYENFCRALYKPLAFRPIIRMLGMQPHNIF